MIQPTKLKYLEDSYLLEDSASIGEIKTNELWKTILVLDQTNEKIKNKSGNARVSYRIT